MAERQLRFKGSLCDGHVHISAREYADRRYDTFEYLHKKELLKLANNKIFSDETRKALWKAVHMIEHDRFWRDVYIHDVNRQKPLRWKEDNRTELYEDDCLEYCKTCGQYVSMDYIYCPGCGKWIDRGEKKE